MALILAQFVRYLLFKSYMKRDKFYNLSLYYFITDLFLFFQSVLLLSARARFYITGQPQNDTPDDRQITNCHQHYLPNII